MLLTGVWRGVGFSRGGVGRLLFDGCLGDRQTVFGEMVGLVAPSNVLICLNLCMMPDFSDVGCLVLLFPSDRSDGDVLGKSISNQW
jgi:hypothetical protein